MADLTLNQRGKQFALNQRRCADFIQKFSNQMNLNIEIPADYYIGSIVVKSSFLSSLLQKANIQPENQNQTVKNFTLYEDTATQQELDSFQANIAALNELCIKVDAAYKSQLVFDDYEKFVDSFAPMLEKAMQVDGVPQLDFNSDYYLLQFAPTPNEIKLAINLLGTDVIKVEDINTQMDSNQSLLSLKFWPFYILNIILGFSTRVMIINFIYYAQFIGATASQTTNLTTVFNLVQLPVSVILQWLSDIVGRKPIFLLIIAIYAVTMYMMYLAPDVSDNYQTQISYMTGTRALMGTAALLCPLGFVIMSDMATPKNRGIATVLVNVCQTFGGFFSSFLNDYLGSGKQYTVTGYTPGEEEYNKRMIKSYQDAMLWSIGSMIVCFLITVFLVQESHPRILAIRKLKKLGIDTTQYKKEQKEVGKEPMWSVFKKMVTNKDIVLMFFSYFISMIGITNPTSGQSILMSKMYGFHDTNATKAFTGKMMKINTIVNCLVGLLLSKVAVRYLGEVRVIIIGNLLTSVESIMNFSVSYPINKYLLYATGPLSSSAVVVCDALYLQMASMYSTPQNRGQVLGIFQIGNSLMRIISNWITGINYDWQIRDSQLIDMWFQACGLYLLAIMHPPIQRNEMEKAAKQQSLDKKNVNMI